MKKNSIIAIIVPLFWAIVMMLVMVFAMLGSIVNVHAEEERKNVYIEYNDKTVFPSFPISKNGFAKYMLLRYEYDDGSIVYHLRYFDGEVVLNDTNAHNWSGYGTPYICLHESVSERYTWNPSGNDGWVQISTTTIGAGKHMVVGGCDMYIISTNFTMYTETGNLYLAPLNAKYMHDFGYIKDLSLKTLRVDGVQDLVYKFSFAPTSTKGVDLSNDEFVIRLYGQLAYYDMKTGVLAQHDDNMVYVGDFDINNNSIQFGLQSVYDAVAKKVDLLDTWTLTTLGWTRSDSLYLQIYNRVTGEYGGLVRFSNTSNVTGKDDTVTTVTPDGETDNGGYVGGDVNNSVGSGGSIDDAIQDADKEVVDIWSGFDSFSSILDGISETLGGVSGAFDSIFSFLPSYCRTLFGLSVSAMLLIALVKFIRG